MYQFHARHSLSGFYTRSSTVRRRYEAFLLKHCIGKQILEYGCGLGSYGFFLASHGAKVTGIDISEVAINEAWKQAETENVEINFQVMNAESLKLPNDSFDVICGTGILHHLNLQKAVREIRRVLKPDGKAIFIEPLGHNPLINLFRTLTPRMRSRDEHPLTMADLKMLGEEFPRHTFEFYYLIALTALPFHGMKSFTKLANTLDWIDQKAFTIFPFLKKFSWQVLLLLEK